MTGRDDSGKYAYLISWTSGQSCKVLKVWDHRNSKTQDHRKSNLPKVRDQALKFCSYAGLASWWFFAMHCSSDDSMVGEGYRNLGGGTVGASCAVYVAEVLPDSLACETTMQWRNQNSILLAIEHFKPGETKFILQGDR